MEYDPRKYWEQRLEEDFDLSGVGHTLFSESYNKYLYRRYWDAFRTLIRTEVLDLEGASVCDVGSGTGFFVDLFDELGVEDLVGLDITEKSVEQLLASYPSYRFVQADISATELPSEVAGEYDITNAMNVLFHVTNEDRFERSIRNLTELTASDGHLVISDRMERHAPSSHVQFRSFQRYRDLLADVGFEITVRVPLFWTLNRPLFGRFASVGLHVDDHLAPLYYRLDRIGASETRSNMSVLVATPD